MVSERTKKLGKPLESDDPLAARVLSPQKFSSGDDEIRKATPADTQCRILDAAEQLFIQNGFSATSLRAIAKLADVNLAATHYHFGSKEGLLAATVHRRMKPINESRMQQLGDLSTQSETTVENRVDVFLSPLKSKGFNPMLPKLMARVYGEPESISKPLIDNEFSELLASFIDLLSKTIPQVPETELRWRFHFVVGALLQLLNFPAPQGLTSVSEQAGYDALKAFAIAGLMQGCRDTS